tara:strand:+ start:581 stop:739 length:159 start_codon:yes stop_codon:yes gene_type:complete
MYESHCRPDLKPVDPRATANPTNDFDIIGSIDNANTFNAATGKSTSHRQEIE